MSPLTNLVINICMAVVMFIGAGISIGWVRKSKPVSVALIGVLGLVSIYTLLNVSPIEDRINHQFSGTTPLIKGLIPIVLLVFFNILWLGIGVRKHFFIQWIIPLLLAIWRVATWLPASVRCTDIDGLGFDECANKEPMYVACSIAVMVTAALWGIMTAKVLLPMASARRSTVSRTVLVLVLAIITASLWCLSVAWCAWTLSHNTELSRLQHYARTITSVVGSGLLLVGVYWLPVESAQRRFRFRRATREVVARLNEISTTTVTTSGSYTTRLMDKLSVALADHDIKVVDALDYADSKRTAQWLTGSPILPCSIPKTSSTEDQANWLVSVATHMS